MHFLTDAKFLLIATVLCPLIAFFVTVVGSWFFRGWRSHCPLVIASGLSFVSSLALTVKISNPQWGRLNSIDLKMFRWVDVPGDISLLVTFGLRSDGLSTVLLLTTTFIVALVAVYASKSLQDEQDRCRFFAKLSLLLFATISLLLSTDFVQLFLFWQLLVVIASLLTAFRFKKPRAIAAAQSVFFVNRIADAGMFIALFLIWLHFGTFDIEEVFVQSKIAEIASINPVVISGICVCLFAGAVGRCAQFPLYVWLKDMHEAPSPVNAVLQSTTLMMAGIYVIARCSPLFAAARETLLLVAFVGGFTALLASAIAVALADLRRVLSFSTSAILGLALLGLGTNSDAGRSAAIFLLICHAFSKALLFLAVENVACATNGNCDLRRLGGLRHVLPMTYWTFLIGAVVMGSGLWGQSAILRAVSQAAEQPLIVSCHDDLSNDLFTHEQSGQPLSLASLGRGNEESTLLLGYKPSTVYYGLMWLAIFSMAFTSLAIFRAFCMTFHGVDRDWKIVSSQSSRSTHASQWILAVAVVAIGPAFGGPPYLLSTFLERTSPSIFNSSMASESGGVSLFIAGMGFPVALVGIVVAWIMYVRPSNWPQRTRQALGPFVRLSENQFYLEHCFLLFVDRPLQIVARLCRLADRNLIERLFPWTLRRIVIWCGRAAEPLQNTGVQYYALSMMLAIGVLLFVLLWLRE